MQAAVPEAIDLAKETEATTKLYGLDNDTTKVAGQQLLASRRLVERDVRFVQVFPSPYGSWDSHQNLKDNHTRLCETVDLPVAGLLQDLKQRGLLDDVVVVFGTEFGRTPGLELRGAETLAATTTPTDSRSGWREQDSNGATSTARPTSSATTHWAKGIT